MKTLAATLLVLAAGSAMACPGDKSASASSSQIRDQGVTVASLLAAGAGPVSNASATTERLTAPKSDTPPKAAQPAAPLTK